jgi:hypothetical protein
MKIRMDFGPYGAFPSSDVPEMVDQQNSWNSLVISIYLLYLEWNGGMLAVNICILWPPRPRARTPRRSLHPRILHLLSIAAIYRKYGKCEYIKHSASVGNNDMQAYKKKGLTTWFNCRESI